MAIGTTAAILGSAAIGAVASGRASSRAASAQQSAGNSQIAENRRVYADQTARFAPYLESGGNALNAYNYELGLGQRPEGYAGFQATPGYDFALQEGQRAIDGSAASRGNLFSGATLRAQQDRGIGMANQEYNNFLNRLGGSAQAGQAAAGMQATAAGNMGQGNTNALGAIGNARAAGAIGQGNAINSGINNALSGYMFLNQSGGGQGNSLFGGNSWG